MDRKSIKSWFGNKKVQIAILVLIAFLAGYMVRSRSLHEHEGASANSEKQTVWTCSMHPQIRESEPGKCPLCGMDLIPVTEGGAGELQIEFSEVAKKLMEIETAAVERKFVTAQIRMVGKLDYDETKVKNITSWVKGRVDRLYVDYTGITVSKGDHMVYLYSPQLLSAQAELLQAVKSAGNIKAESSEFISKSILSTLKAAREKIRLLGLDEKQIADIEKTGEPVNHLNIYAPIGGVVIQKNVTEGMYVKTGTRIYTIADLSQLWAKLDAYESDMMWIRYGQEVEFTAEAYPGEVFKGRISFIDPVLNDKTRTVKLRVNVDNSNGRLKPGMFVRAVVRSKVAEAGKVMDEQMAGKWVCPMHLDIVKEAFGTCDICGMDLVTSESLGFASPDGSQAPLVIPATAPLITGKRAIVYVQVQDSEKPTYIGKEIELGPRAGDHYIVNSGLMEGEIVVTNGNFKIDSEMQLQGKQSMMNPEGAKDSDGQPRP